MDSFKLYEVTESRIVKQLNELCFIAGRLHQRQMSWVAHGDGSPRYEWLPVPSFKTIAEADAS